MEKIVHKHMFNFFLDKRAITSLQSGFVLGDSTVNLCLFDFILYVPSTIFQLNKDGSSWVEPVLS